MGHRKDRSPPAAAKPPEFRVNPFAHLRVGTPEPTPTATPPPAARASAPTPLSAADRRLAHEFAAGAAQAAGPQVSVRLEPRARGVRMATVLHGLPLADVAAAMQVVEDLRTALGVKVTWREDEVEIDGDRRSAAEAWLTARGFRVCAKE